MRGARLSARAVFPLHQNNVDPTVTTDPGVDLPRIQIAFLAMVNAESLLGFLTGIVRIPMDATARLQLGTIVASEVGEAGLKPVARLGFDVATAPTKVAVQVVISMEAMRSFDPATQDGIRAVLVSACAAASDQVLVDTLTAGAPIGSATPAALLAAISNGQPQRPA